MHYFQVAVKNGIVRIEFVKNIDDPGTKKNQNIKLKPSQISCDLDILICRRLHTYKERMDFTVILVCFANLCVKNIQ